jgi:hypothetical protein
MPSPTDADLARMLEILETQVGPIQTQLASKLAQMVRDLQALRAKDAEKDAELVRMREAVEGLSEITEWSPERKRAVAWAKAMSLLFRLQEGAK